MRTWMVLALFVPGVAWAQDEGAGEEVPAEPAGETEAEEAPAEPPEPEPAAEPEPEPSLRSDGETPPAPVPPSTGQDHVPTVEPPSGPERTLTPYGEVRSELSFARLDYLDSRVSDKSPTTSLGISRALLGVAADSGTGITARVSLLAGLDNVRADAEAPAPSTSIRIQLAWVGYSLGRAGTLVIGHQPLPFGVRMVYEQDAWFYVPGGDAFFDLQTRRGVTTPQQTALSWQLDLPMDLELDVAVGNPTEGTLLDQEWALDFSGRLRWHSSALPAVAGVSALSRQRDAGRSTGAWHAYAGAFLDPADLRVLAQLMGTWGWQEDSLGFGLDAQATLDLDLGRCPASGVTVLGRLERWDEQRSLALDEVWSVDLGASLALDSGEDGPPIQLGLLYELDVPMDAALAIEHSVGVQGRAMF